MSGVFIIDDEKRQLDFLINRIPWSEYGFEIVGYAENGSEALKIISVNETDIVITDIKMPEMDGIAFANKLRDLSPRIKIVFLTAYDDSDYLKSAIKLNVFEYIIKPYSLSDILSLLSRLSAKCEEEKKANLEQKLIKFQIHEMKSYVCEKLIMNLMRGVSMKDSDIYCQINDLGIDVLCDKFLLLLVEVDHYYEERAKLKGKMKYLFKFKIFNDIKIYLSKYASIPFSAHIVNDNLYAVIIKDDAISGYKKSITSLVDNINREINTAYGLTVTVGISNPSQDPQNLFQMFTETVDLLQYKFFAGNRQIIWMDDVKDFLNLGNSQMIQIGKYEERLALILKTGNSESVPSLMHDLFYELQSSSSLNREHIQSFCLRLLSAVSLILAQMNVKFEDVYGKDIPERTLLRSETSAELRQHLTQLLSRATDILSQKYKSRNGMLVQKILAIIEKRYAENLTLEMIAEEVCLSPGYTTTLFRQQTGISITQSIIKTRIDKAMELLQKPESRVNEVARCVGYNNTAFFSSLFKNHIGITPKEFRNRSLRNTKQAKFEQLIET